MAAQNHLFTVLTQEVSDNWESLYVAAPSGITWLTKQNIYTMCAYVNCFSLMDLPVASFFIHLQSFQGLALLYAIDYCELDSRIRKLCLPYFSDRDNFSHTIQVFAVDWIDASVENVGGVKYFFSSKIHGTYDKIKIKMTWQCRDFV